MHRVGGLLSYIFGSHHHGKEKMHIAIISWQMLSSYPPENRSSWTIVLNLLFLPQLNFGIFKYS